MDKLKNDKNYHPYFRFRNYTNFGTTRTDCGRQNDQENNFTQSSHGGDKKPICLSK